ncbi:RadC family protein [Ferrimonas gelatinilytica]|uniref:DNA repair protein RadC n=1 Tax=Ferrimonas gelatinilytica TaxID=1255257 RepID=A0ABP9SAB2_9GAMM
MSDERKTDYVTEGPMTVTQVLEKAADILADRFVTSDAYCSPARTKAFLSFKLGRYEREVFALMLLDNQNRLIQFVELFQGTIDAASVYPREVVKVVLQHNAAGVILAHNHPSGEATPSEADRTITRRLIEALGLIDVRVLDHIVVGKDSVSFAERGLL